MQLSIAPKFGAPQSVVQKQTPRQPAFEAESTMAEPDLEGKPSPLYAVAVMVRIGILGIILFHALTIWP